MNEKNYGDAFYEKKETARKIAKLLAEKNFTISEAEEVIDMTMQDIKLNSIVRCFDFAGEKENESGKKEKGRL